MAKKIIAQGEKLSVAERMKAFAAGGPTPAAPSKLPRSVPHGEVKTFSDEPALVTVRRGSTINMGNYESMRLDIGITMPCKPDEVNKVIQQLDKEIADELKTKTDKIKSNPLGNLGFIVEE